MSRGAGGWRALPWTYEAHDLQRVTEQPTLQDKSCPSLEPCNIGVGQNQESKHKQISESLLSRASGSQILVANQCACNQILLSLKCVLRSSPQCQTHEFRLAIRTVRVHPFNDWHAQFCLCLLVLLY